MTQPVFLYVEDDALSREIMQMMMGGLGYNQLTIFPDSENFLARAEALTPRPDVILLDVHVLPYDGFEMLDMLRSSPVLADRTVIAVTASVMNEEVSRLRTVGFNGAIGKPLDFDAFSDLIDRVLRGEEVWYVA